MVETRSTGVGQLIENQRVLELPLNGRQVTDLLLLSPAVTINTTGGFASSRNYPTVPISVAGGSPGSTVYIMDGANHNDPGTNFNLPVPFPDALQEFKIETSALSARYGHHAAAVVNVVTKSGTNDFNGSLFEFVRDGRFNAKNAFALSKDSLRRHQFGGAVGGPIAAEPDLLLRRLSGHGYQDRSRARLQAFVPTADMLSGRLHGGSLARLQRRPADRAEGRRSSITGCPGAVRCRRLEVSRIHPDIDRPVRPPSVRLSHAEHGPSDRRPRRLPAELAAFDVHALHGYQLRAAELFRRQERADDAERRCRQSGTFARGGRHLFAEQLDHQFVPCDRHPLDQPSHAVGVQVAGRVGRQGVHHAARRRLHEPGHHQCVQHGRRREQQRQVRLHDLSDSRTTSTWFEGRTRSRSASISCTR